MRAVSAKQLCVAPTDRVAKGGVETGRQWRDHVTVAEVECEWYSWPMRASKTRQLETLETDYRELLLSALQKCVAGHWGLFAHNEPASTQLSPVLRSRLLDPAVQELLALGSKIEGLRARFGLEPFQLHERLLKMRSCHGSNSPGEPKLAQRWLDELRHTRMGEVEKRGLVASWIALCLASGDSATRDANFWAYEKFESLRRTSPDECWELIHAIRQADSSDPILANLAAGPLEDMLVDHGHRYFDEVERLARTDAQFRKMLGAVRKNDIADDVWSRVQRVAGPSF